MAIKFVIFMLIVPFISCQSNVYQFQQKASNHSKTRHEFVGHSIETLNNHILVTQCSIACLKNLQCLSYNHNPKTKICTLNNDNHLSKPSSLKVSATTNYYLRDAFSIDVKADACLEQPCKNDATCLSSQHHQYSCLCAPLWSGPHCDVKLESKWAAWQEWSQCSEKCGDGVKERKRRCVRMVGGVEMTGRADDGVEWCEGFSKKMEACILQLCPYWETWHGWSECSSLGRCGTGESSRKRKCVNDSPKMTCGGNRKESRRCQSIDCRAEVLIKPLNASLEDSFGEGMLKVRVEGEWLDVCYKSWSLENADTVCRQTGFNTGSYTSMGVKSIAANQKSVKAVFKCTANQNSLLKCPHSDWAVGSCEENKGVYIECKVDGRWAKWTEWSDCSVSCASGERMRSRKCNSPPAKNTGAECEGVGVEKKLCDMPPCPVDGFWKPWQEWSGCSKSCGLGIQIRKRSCNAGRFNGKDCEGKGEEEQTCNPQPCPVHAFWKEWVEWSACNISCGGGEQTRKRTCVEEKYGGNPCEGENDQKKVCNTHPCPVDGYWNEWESWSECDVTCGGGTRTRQRYCVEPLHSGVPCAGRKEESSDCSIDPCPIDSTWGSWAEWSSCSVTCGGGKRIRSRICSPALHGGVDCVPEDAQSEEFCNDDPCKIDGQWSLWSRWLECSVTCGDGQEKRYRKCSAPLHGGSTCGGKPEEFRECSLPLCPTPAEWTGWSEWSRCSETCGEDGVRERRRTCEQTETGPNSLPCLNPDTSSENKKCNRFKCLPHVSSCQMVFERGLEEDSFIDTLFIGSQTSTTTRVYCSNKDLKVTTIINSNFEKGKIVSLKSNLKQNNYRLVYSSDGAQTSTEDLRTLVYNSKECKQYVSWKCKNFPLNIEKKAGDVKKMVYWKNKYSEEMMYWGGATNDVNKKGVTCKCGEDGSCTPYLCRCDANSAEWMKDDGMIDNKFDLPITEVVAIGNDLPEQEGEFIIGPLICS